MDIERESGPSEFWATFLGEKDGPLCGLAIETLGNLLTQEKIDAALAAIAREESVGPIFNPSAYLDGRRWENALIMRELFITLRHLVDAEHKRQEEWR